MGSPEKTVCSFETPIYICSLDGSSTEISRGAHFFFLVRLFLLVGPFFLLKRKVLTVNTPKISPPANYPFLFLPHKPTFLPISFSLLFLFLQILTMSSPSISPLGLPYHRFLPWSHRTDPFSCLGSIFFFPSTTHTGEIERELRLKKLAVLSDKNKGKSVINSNLLRG